MSTLTGQQIKDTYDGLLKLEDSTNGITANLQPIQDGLGNNTGSRIATDILTAPNVVSILPLYPDYMGNGVSSAAPQAMSTTTFNKLQYNIFYDSGLYSYSAITYNLGTLTTTSDVVSFLFYTTQWVPGYGVAPKDLIMSGITWLSSGTTGFKTTSLPSTLSFSGTGGGFYIYALYVQNAGVAPSVRYHAPTTGLRQNSYTESVGYVMNTAGNTITFGSRVGFTAAQVGIQLDRPPQTSYSVSDITTYALGTQIVGMAGFGLNVIK